jgi:PTH1 family peptidyl-tRNA hydrolase
VPWLVVGLGNPGAAYARHRHNIGFMVTDELARQAGVTLVPKDKFKGALARVTLGGADAILLQPQTWMNRSGISVGLVASFYGCRMAETLVVHDELDLPFEQLRLKLGGGHAGHNGLRSIFEHFGRDFHRLRCGIGRPARGDAVGFVLSGFTKEEAARLEDLVHRAAEASGMLIRDGLEKTMNTVHSVQETDPNASQGGGR